jgi:hypothetical protein
MAGEQPSGSEHGRLVALPRVAPVCLRIDLSW